MAYFPKRIIRIDSADVVVILPMVIRIAIVTMTAEASLVVSVVTGPTIDLVTELEADSTTGPAIMIGPADLETEDATVEDLIVLARAASQDIIEAEAQVLGAHHESVVAVVMDKDFKIEETSEITPEVSTHQAVASPSPMSQRTGEQDLQSIGRRLLPNICRNIINHHHHHHSICIKHHHHPLWKSMAMKGLLGEVIRMSVRLFLVRSERRNKL